MILCITRRFSFVIDHFDSDILLISQAIAVLPSFCLVILQLHSNMDPIWFYLSSALSSVISWIAVALVRNTFYLDFRY
jgi:hypothetical protein